MGYHTSYKLKIKIGNSDLIGQFIDESEEAKTALDSYGDTEESCKWYDHEQELKLFSLKHPLVLFELKGEGDENEDVWIKYFQNGKCQICKAKIIFDEFDSAKLK